MHDSPRGTVLGDSSGEPSPGSLNLIRKILLKEGEASLGTLTGESPFVTGVNYLFRPGEGDRLGDFYLFLSGLAHHSKNIGKNPAVSLFIVEKDAGIPLPERKRLSVTGRAETVSSDPEKKLLETQYRHTFPFSETFFMLPDFQFYRIRPQTAHWIAGFGEIRNWQFEK